MRFDPDTRVDEPQAKQPRTEMYSPTFAGDISSSPTSKQEGTSSGSGVVRRAIQGVELYDYDEDMAAPSGPLDKVTLLVKVMAERSARRKRRSEDFLMREEGLRICEPRRAGLPGSANNACRVGTLEGACCRSVSPGLAPLWRMR